jgi:hypothetical protein
MGPDIAPCGSQTFLNSSASAWLSELTLGEPDTHTYAITISTSEYQEN